MPFFRKLLTCIITALASGYFVHVALKNFSGIPQVYLNGISIVIAFGCIGLIIINIIIAGTIWHFLLRDNVNSISWKQTQIIFLIAQFAKYIPGNVAQHIGRVLMARESGIPIHITMHNMVLELLWGISLAAGLSVVSLIFFVESNAIVLPWHMSIPQLVSGVFVLLLMPWIGIGLINTYLPKLAERLSGSRKITSPKPATAFLVFLLFFLCFLILGIILKLQAVWFFNVDDGNLLQFTCLFAIAWLAGYLVPGAPGGLGVREAMMVLVFAPIVGAGTAVGLGITLRITTTIGDALAFLLGLYLKKTSIIRHD